MRVSDMARISDFDVNLFFTGKSKPTEKPEYTPIDMPFTAPNWGNIPTKNSNPRMSDEEYENAIRELARKEASQGILASTDEKRKLRVEYMSVASPDRKAIYNDSMAKTGGKMNSTLSFYDKDGKKSFHYNSQARMWFWQGTAEEKARKSRFNDIYTQAFSEYEAEYGEITRNPHVKHFNAYG